jgi:hypothetical protein
VRNRTVGNCGSSPSGRLFVANILIRVSRTELSERAASCDTECDMLIVSCVREKGYARGLCEPSGAARWWEHRDPKGVWDR